MNLLQVMWFGVLRAVLLTIQDFWDVMLSCQGNSSPCYDVSQCLLSSESCSVSRRVQHTLDLAATS
jgi:hypothetical protein